MEHDVFISHASEDKDAFVRDLATSLRNKGLAVWYDDFALRLGDSLSASISKGLASSSFGVVVISPHFIAKRWPQRELAALIAREDYVDKVILPIWHGVTKADLLANLPLLADKLAANSVDGVEAVAKKIIEVVSPERVAEGKYQRGLESELKGDRDAARSDYIETLHIDMNHGPALARLVGLLSAAQNSHRSGITLGRIKYYSAAKGFGFITAEDGQEYFVHVFTLESHGVLSLTAGERVAFLIGEGRGKRQAVSVRTIPDGPDFVR
jgi:cold shock CspA family protein